ncbi:DUF2390 domain-containing protein [Shewanella yunxiaonensis]|uniref:DUF2390 domain-containing protein n=1 Tax=Shewanella yunxiaonensis TaxID=2829809 RepID=A0ABX7YRP0_9GAMM|nr:MULTISPECIES: DUF2390 domain-containing protein [Shewanella]MDF0535527.1 DUF2390 domain-containing protein [Shewanella sp. A32]QUN05302.1 DUF2390 domain-containing protein [Shewanella yunxiaonensis]
MSTPDILTPSWWRACEQYYPAIEATAIQLQDQHGIIINLLLLALALDKQQLQLPSDCWQPLQQQVLAWQSRMLSPYRQLRKLAKDFIEQDEYQQMLRVELLLERKSQQLISLTLRHIPLQPTNNTPTNRRDYLAQFQLELSAYPALTHITDSCDTLAVMP